jgi:integrase
MKTISTLLQAKKAAPGLYAVKDAEGVTLNKRGEAFGAGAFNFRFTPQRPGAEPKKRAKRPADAPMKRNERLLMSLGSPNDFNNLEEVRDAATAARKLVKEGINPIDERERRRSANLAVKQPLTFKQKAEAVRDVYTPTLKHKYALGNWFNPIKRHVIPIIGDLPINDIEPRHVAAVLAAVDAAGLSKSGPRLRAHIAMIFNAAIANGDRDPLRGNPADSHLMRAMRPGTSKSDDEHYRRIELTDAPEKVRALQAAREAADEALMAAALDAWLFMIATALRPGEALKTQWSEVDLQKKLVTVSAARMKGRKGKTKPHTVPLSSLALEVLERRQARKNDADTQVFAGPNGVPPSHTYFALAAKRVGLDLGTPHSWRSVFSDWSGEIGDIAPDLREAALAHKLTAVQAAYRRGSSVEPRRPVMQAFAKWLSGDAGADIIAFPARA